MRKLRAVVMLSPVQITRRLAGIALLAAAGILVPGRTASAEEHTPITYHSPEWAPDGSGIAVMSNRDGPFNAYVIEPESGAITRLTSLETAGSELAWSPDGKYLAISAQNKFVQGFYLLDVETGEVSTIETGMNMGITSWRPQSDFVTVESRVDGNADIYIVRSNGTDIQRLTSNPENDFGAVWSPDGSRIAFSSKRSGKYLIYVKPAADGSAELLIDGPQQYARPDWSPSGNEMLYAAVGDAVCLEIFSFSTKERKCVAKPSRRDPAASWSPDGGMIAFMVDQGDDMAVAVANKDGTGMRVLTGPAN